MAQMSIAQLNELLKRALEGLQADGQTMVTLDDQPSSIDCFPEMPRRVPSEPEVTVADVLETGIPKLWHGTGKWGNLPGALHGMARRPHRGNPQPLYEFECYQCGRPITRVNGWEWQDHAGKTVCDLTFVDPTDVATESYWTDHRPKPDDGEEEDE